MKKQPRRVILPDGRIATVLAVRGGYTITDQGTYAPYQLKNLPEGADERKGYNSILGEGQKN